LPPASTLVSCSAYSTLKVEAMFLRNVGWLWLHGVIIEYSNLRGLFHSPKQKFTHTQIYKFPKRLESITVSWFYFRILITTLGLKELNCFCVGVYRAVSFTYGFFLSYPYNRPWEAHRVVSVEVPTFSR
jgi:hypothetical protein